MNFCDEDFLRFLFVVGVIDNILECLKWILDSGVIVGGDRFFFLGFFNS